MLSEEGTRQTSSFMHDFLHVIVELWMNISSSCLPCVKHIWTTIYFARRVAPSNLTCLAQLIKYLRGHDVLRTTSVFLISLLKCCELTFIEDKIIWHPICSGLALSSANYCYVVLTSANYRAIMKYCIQSPVSCWCRTPDTLSVVASHWRSRDWCGHQQHSHYQSPPTRHPRYS